MASKSLAQTTDSSQVIIRPESDDRTLCVEMGGWVRQEDHRKVFHDKMGDMVAKNGWFNIVIYFNATFKGWEAEAADSSFKSILAYGPHTVRLAYINPPEKRIFLHKVSPVIKGEIRYFEGDDLGPALSWAKAGRLPA